MNFLGNLIWLICGGFLSAIGYIIGGFLMCCTIIGIPFGIQMFKIGGLVLWPFGKKVVSRGGSSGCLSTIFNIIWIFTGGLYTAFIHIVFAALLFITVIGIPFARQHMKLAELAFMPFGKDVIG
jgi:uncharacterized membrane protein YccF (DUF307 family)